jgi:hypothetical protein
VIPLSASVDPDRTAATLEGNDLVLRLVKFGDWRQMTATESLLTLPRTCTSIKGNTKRGGFQLSETKEKKEMTWEDLPERAL